MKDPIQKPQEKLINIRIQTLTDTHTHTHCLRNSLREKKIVFTYIQRRSEQCVCGLYQSR